MTSKEEIYASIASLLADATPAAKLAFERLSEDCALLLNALNEQHSDLLQSKIDVPNEPATVLENVEACEAEQGDGESDR